MADISKIKALNGTTYNIKDTIARTGITVDCFTVADFVSRFINVGQPYIVQVRDNAASALSNNLSLNMTLTGYKTFDEAYIVYYATEGTPRFFSGYIQLSNNAVTVNQMYPIRRVTAKFTGVTVSAGGYKKLCDYSQVLPSGLGEANIVSVYNYAGSFTGAQAIQPYSDGIYLYSSHAYTNKDITLAIFYSPYVTIQADPNITIDVS